MFLLYFSSPIGLIWINVIIFVKYVLYNYRVFYYSLLLFRAIFHSYLDKMGPESFIIVNGFHENKIYQFLLIVYATD